MKKHPMPLDAWQKSSSQMGALPSFREIKRRLKKEALDGAEGHNLILFTNLDRGTGATQCAMALMQSIGLEQDTTAMFVDANVFNPVFPKSFSSGLMSYLDPKQTLTEELDKKLSEIITKDEDARTCDLCDDPKRLKWLPLGSVSNRSNELFASSRMRSLLKELSSRYDDRLVIIDGPCILKSAEGRTLVEHVHQLVVVVEEGKTLVSDLESFKKLIPEHVIVHYLLNNSIDPNLSEQYQTLSV